MPHDKEMPMANKTGNDKNNVLDGTRGDDVIKGMGGEDTLLGRGGNDQLHGGTGDDTLSGDTGNDKAFGEAGNDLLYVSEGKDVLDGGGGANILSFYYIYQGMKISLADHAVTFHTGRGSNTTHFSNVQALQGSAFNDTLTGDAHGNLLLGSFGDDVLKGADGDDYLVGGDGREIMTGGRGSDGFLFGATTAEENFDRVRDFSDKDDWLAFDDKSYKGIKGTDAGHEWTGILTARHIDAGQFQTGHGHEAGTADVRIIYDDANGTLYYDGNGSGAGGLGEIANIGRHHELTAGDIFVF
jgi:Ca2+-binding RTX toxin-like protein